MRPLFSLGPRLALCAALVREGSPLCDVGTDHAYLPIWLLKTGKVPRALACDINPGPLEAARRDGAKYEVGEELSFRLSDGLRAVLPLTQTAVIGRFCIFLCLIFSYFCQP